MNFKAISRFPILAVAALATVSVPAAAHKLREAGDHYDVAKSDLVVTPPRDWNRLSERPGKHAETWTLDGEQLNDVTFYGEIQPGDPLVKERHKKKDPLPKFRANTLLIEIPELLEGTYRTYKKIGRFDVQSVEPMSFLGSEGVYFTFEYVDQTQLTRKGEARAAIIDGELFMLTFEAPRLHYYDQTIADFRALADTARLE
tara:strand:+ start:887 stop:1489 length:603 start_codon:yes stop_codon:yes gene_type:complete